MPKHILQTILEGAQEEGAGYQIRSYSGRAMYGKECLGVVCKDLADILPILFQACASVDHGGYNGDDGDVPDDLSRAFEGMRQDSMGLSNIYYFPRIPYLAPEDELEERLNAEIRHELDQEQDGGF